MPIVEILVDLVACKQVNRLAWHYMLMELVKTEQWKACVLGVESDGDQTKACLTKKSLFL